MADVLVVGAGVGGLAAAVVLAARGLRVEVVEAMERPGGKLNVAVVEGVEVDTGPSVLTMPDALDAIFRAAGTSLSDELSLREPEPGFRYLYPDGAVVDVYPRLEETIASVERALGAGPARELESFLGYSRRIWEAAAPHFVYGPAPSLAGILRSGPGALRALTRIDPLHRMYGAIRARVRSPHLRWLLARYATYNGSDPRRAPATLNCIAHVELGLGGYGVEGGMYEVVRALARTAERLGVGFHYGARVARVDAPHGSVREVRAEDGRGWRVPAVVANAEASHVLSGLLEPSLPAAPAECSMSGWVGIARARRRTGADARVAHTVLFPEAYLDEFADIFDRGRPPADPTVYLCAQEVCHGRPGWAEEEPLFLMANAPPATEDPGDGLGEVVRARLESSGLLEFQDRIVWERTPADLARDFPGSGGSIYGAASNSPLAAFRRPANRVQRVRGLYLASGGAHPGGGVPLCALSGRAAAEALLEDWKE